MQDKVTEHSSEGYKPSDISSIHDEGYDPVALKNINATMRNAQGEGDDYHHFNVLDSTRGLKQKMTFEN